MKQRTVFLNEPKALPSLPTAKRPSFAESQTAPSVTPAATSSSSAAANVPSIDRKYHYLYNFSVAFCHENADIEPFPAYLMPPDTPINTPINDINRIIASVRVQMRKSSMLIPWALLFQPPFSTGSIGLSASSNEGPPPSNTTTTVGSRSSSADPDIPPVCLSY